jgi:peptidoglycan/LPS O-acetylase OafA/YrhL
LGSLRFLLAFSVVIFHLSAQVPILGQLAVNMFYIVSGYLITLVLNETYRGRTGAFVANRFLRLYPAYYVCAVTVLILHMAFPAMREFHPVWKPPLTPESSAFNLLMFPWGIMSDPNVPLNFLKLDILQSSIPYYRLVPSTWSVGVEVVCYALLWAVAARSLRAALVTLSLGAAWHLYVWAFGPNQDFRYSPVAAAVMPFAFGALAYFLKPWTARLERWRGSNAFYAAWIGVTGLAFLLNWWLDFPSTVSTPSYFVNYLIGFAAVLVLQDARASGALARIDKLLGDLSYPMFLSHYIAGGLVYQVMAVGTPVRGWAVFFVGGVATLVFSLLIVFLVDRPIAGLRDRVRAESLNALRLRPS